MSFILLLLAACAVAAQEPASQGSEIIVPAGTTIPIVLTTFLNTKGTQVGDSFYADTVYPIWIQQRLVIPKGSTIKGIVTEIVRPGRIKGKGRLAVRFENVLLPNGVTRDLNAVFHGIHSGGDQKMDRKTETVEESGSKGQDAGTIIGYGSQGAIIGAIAGRSGTDAGIGAGAGAAVGLATVLLTRGRDLVLEPGTQFDVELKQPLKFAYGELDFTNAQLNNAERSFIPRPSQRRQQPPGYSARRPGIFPRMWPW
jgi:type IV secretion system protein VirB10